MTVRCVKEEMPLCSLYGRFQWSHTPYGRAGNDDEFRKYTNSKSAVLEPFPATDKTVTWHLPKTFGVREVWGCGARTHPAGKGLKSLWSKPFNFLSVLSRYCNDSITFLCYFSWQVISGQLKKHSHSWDEASFFSRKSDSFIWVISHGLMPFFCWNAFIMDPF